MQLFYNSDMYDGKLMKTVALLALNQRHHFQIKFTILHCNSMIHVRHFQPLLLLLLLVNFFTTQSGSIARYNPINKYTLTSPFPVPFANKAIWHTSGSTLTNQEVIRLTPDKQSYKGGFWTSSPITDLGQEWEVTLGFNIWGGGETYFGDGMALWYTAQPSLTGKVFGARDYWKGLGILFDTYDNGNRQTQNHPYITVMYNDGTHSFVHGDSGLQSGIPACHATFRNVFKSTASRMNPPFSQSSNMKIRYYRGRVTVDINLLHSDTWTRCIDVENVILPDTGYYFGMTASTGDLSDNHDIHSFKVASTKAPSVPTVETKAEGIVNDYENEKLRNENKMNPNFDSNKNGGDGVKTNSDDDVSEIVQQSDVYQMLVKQGVVHDEKMNAIKLHLKEQLNGKNDTYYF